MKNVTYLSLYLLNSLVPYLNQWLYVDDSFITFIDQKSCSIGLRVITSIQMEDEKLNNLVYNFFKKNGIRVIVEYFVYEDGGYNFTFGYSNKGE